MVKLGVQVDNLVTATINVQIALLRTFPTKRINETVLMPDRIFLSPPHMGRAELAFIREAFESNYIAPLGPQVDAFEKEFAEYIGINHCVALSSGTAAMHLALRRLAIGPGDLVVGSTLTFIGSVSPITFLGATPVLVDCDRETWNMDPALLEEVLAMCASAGKIPKAVIPTDLYGQCADYEQILRICNQYRIPVVADAAESLGAQVKIEGRKYHAGGGTAAAIYSFNGNKIITTSGGGMLASDDEDMVAYARYLSQQARLPLAHYEHEEIGYNYRMSNVLAAIGRGQLQMLDERIQTKRQICDQYKTALSGIPGIQFMPEAQYGQSTRWLTVVLIDPEVFGVEREVVRLALEAENIESRPVWKPMHLQPVFDVKPGTEIGSSIHSNSKNKIISYYLGQGISDVLFRDGLCLPSGTALRDTDLSRIVSAIISCSRP